MVETVAVTPSHKDTFAVCEKTWQVAETTVTAVKGLDETIRHGWREVNTEKLAERIHAELEGTLLQPLAIAMPPIGGGRARLAKMPPTHGGSDPETPRLSFQGHPCRDACRLPCRHGRLLSFGWWKLSRHYDRMVDAALKRILSVNAGNQEAFTRLTEMNVPIRVLPVTDSKKRTIPRKFALVMDHAEDVAVEDTPDGKRVAIYFEKASY